MAAVFGRDANWGRIMAAAGYSGADVDPTKADCIIKSAAGEVQVMKDGFGTDFSEELAKLLPVRLAARDHPAFDYRFAAIVYSVSSALGFAAVENILYVVQADLRTAVSRAVLSVPGHFFFAVAMGLLLSRAKQAEKKGNGRRPKVLCALEILDQVVQHGN